MWWRKRLLPQTARRGTERQLRRALRKGLQELGIQPPLSVETLCRALGERRGREIELQARALPPAGPSGLWLETAEVDVILYQERTTRLHQDHIILHEIGHIIMSDRQRARSSSMDRAMIEKYADITGLEPEAVQRVAQRCALDDDEECAVELVATILMEWDSVLDLAPPAVSEDPAVRRVQTALGDRRGWL